MRASLCTIAQALIGIHAELRWIRLQLEHTSDPNNGSKPTLAERLASVPVAGVH